MGSVNQNSHQDFIDHYLITYNIIVILIIFVVTVVSHHNYQNQSRHFQLYPFHLRWLFLATVIWRKSRCSILRNLSSVVITTVISGGCIIILSSQNTILWSKMWLLFCVEFVVSRINKCILQMAGSKVSKHYWPQCQIGQQ